MPKTPTIAYLTTRYPSVSLTFVQREIAQIRKMGIKVTVLSVRSPGPLDLLGEINQREAELTHYIVRSWLKVGWHFLLSLVSAPRTSLKVFREAFLMAEPSLKSVFLHFAYSLESLYVAKIVSKAKNRHIHVHFANNGAAVARLACIAKPELSYSVSVHGPSDFNETTARHLDNRLGEAKFVRCISQFCKAELQRHLKRKISDMPIIHCGVEALPDMNAMRDLQKGLTVLSVGRLVAVKGFDVLIRAIASLNDSLLIEQLQIVGAGPEESNLRRLTKELKIEAKVNFVGALSPADVMKALSRADIFAMGSRSEGVPVVLMEAMAKGVPVIAPNIAGIPELIDHEQNGLLYKAQDVGSLASGLQILCVDIERRRRYRVAARKQVEENFNVERETGKLIEILESRKVL